jgi:hypothetical protein
MKLFDSLFIFDQCLASSRPDKWFPKGKPIFCGLKTRKIYKLYSLIKQHILCCEMINS